MDEKEIVELQSLFDSIVCLAVEGPELHPILVLMEAIKKEAIKGYDLCKHHLSEQSNRPDGAGCDCHPYYTNHGRHSIKCPLYKPGG